MPRPQMCRWITSEPPVAAFKPCGTPARVLEVVDLGLDEFEAIRLADMEGLYHEAAAERMGISRATFGRLIESARHKVATALHGPRMLVIKGGTVMMHGKRTFECVDCGSSFQIDHGAGRPTECPSCHSHNFHRAEQDRGRWRGGRGSGVGRGRCQRRCRAFASRNATLAVIQEKEGEQ